MPGRVLLDTHVIIDVAKQGGIETMPARVRRLLEDPEVERLLSVASEVEIAIKHRLRKLDLGKDELALVCNNALVTSYPLRHHHSSALFDLPLHHTDPFDRLIIATALSDDLPVISCDKQFRKYKGLQVIW